MEEKNKDRKSQRQKRGIFTDKDNGRREGQRHPKIETVKRHVNRQRQRTEVQRYTKKKIEAKEKDKTKTDVEERKTEREQKNKDRQYHR